MDREIFLDNNWISLRFNKIFIKVYVRQVFVNVRRNFNSSGHYVRQVLKNYLQPWNRSVYVANFFFQRLAVIFVRKATDTAALNFLPRISEPYKDQVLNLHFLKHWKLDKAYISILLLYFKETWANN